MSLNKVIAFGLLLIAGTPALQAAPAPGVDTPAPAWVTGYRVRFPLRLMGDFTNQKFLTESVIARLPAAGWLREDGTDICVQSQDGQLIPASVLSHNPSGDTLIQFKRHGNDPVYWAYAGNPTAPAANAPPIKEGLTAEFRDWAGDSLANWSDVVDGLKKSREITANSFVDLIAQNVNPGRPDTPRNFTASYRGFLRIADTGIYKFHVGAEDAAFLFIDGNRIYEQKGPNRFKTRFSTSEWAEIVLTKGVHHLELHHVCGTDALLANCVLYWKSDGGKKKLPPSLVTNDLFASATLAEATGIEGAGGATAATFVWGVDDTLTTPGITLHLARFEAQGDIKDPAQIKWDFGDGTRGTGRSPLHVYFKSGDYNVRMYVGADAPLIAKRVYMWTAPVPTSPFSLSQAVASFSTSDWASWDIQRVNTLFDFLAISEQPNRWPLLEKIARHLLNQPDLDFKRRVVLQTTMMEALAEQGRGTESMQLMQDALNAVGKLPTLQVQLLLKGADIQWTYLKEYKEAAQLYEKITSEHRNLDIPSVREAAIHWGDLYTQAGDLVQAGERYRFAKSLGGERFAATGQNEAIQRGAQLRIAEQKLRSGNVRATRLLLERMELDFPDQKLEGMYRFLRAETDRFAGRYDEAIRHYEVLLKLRQWAGFRDRAIHGVADCYFRQEDFAKSLAWLDKLQESFPEYFNLQKLAKFYDVVKASAKSAEAAKKAGATPASLTFRGYSTGFEPGEPPPSGSAVKISFEPMLGFDGPQVGLIKYGTELIYTKELKSLLAGNTCWVEFWYREQLQSREHEARNVGSFVDIAMIEDTVNRPVIDRAYIRLERTYGQWRKAAALLKTPLSQNATVRFLFANTYGGMLQIDALKILPVSDRQTDLLRSFIEASEIE